jgi:hypothetical protein
MSAYPEIEPICPKEPYRMGLTGPEVTQAVQAAQLTIALLAGRPHSLDERETYSEALSFLRSHFRRAARSKWINVVQPE